MFKLEWDEDLRQAHSKILVKNRYSAAGSREKIWRFYRWKILPLSGRSFGLYFENKLLARSGSLFELMETASQASAAFRHSPCTREAWEAWVSHLGPQERVTLPGDLAS